MPEFEVFVSYSRQDEPIVVPIVKLLRLGEHGIVFLDLDSIEPGELWRGKLEQALQSAKYVVLFWCEHSSNSREVEREYRAALATGKRLVPVLLDDTPLPPGLDEYQWVNLAGLARTTHSPAPGSETPTRVRPPDRQTDLPVSRKTEPARSAARLRLTVSSWRGSTPPRPMSADFDELGGTIGRADTSTLVLADPERGISRTQARVMYRSGSYQIVNTGIGLLTVNGNVVDSGGEQALSQGDTVDVGGYALTVAIDTGARSNESGAASADLSKPATAAPLPAQRLPNDFDPFAVSPQSQPSVPGHPSFDDLIPSPQLDELLAREFSGRGSLAPYAADISEVSKMANVIRDELLRRAKLDGLV